MSGGSWEYVMGNYNDMTGNSGFISMPESKYYDKYTSNDVLTACNGTECLSHGLTETAGWYSDSQLMITETLPWMLRGCAFSGNNEAGVFLFINTTFLGGINDAYSFRLTMSPVT